MSEKKRLGRVQVSLSYVVDLDNQDMIDEAKECLWEDLMNIFKYNEIHDHIDVVEDKKATEGDIPDFLKEEETEEEVAEEME